MIIYILCIRHTTPRHRRYMISYLSHASAGNIKRLPYAIKTPSPSIVNDDNGLANGQGWVTLCDGKCNRGEIGVGARYGF